MSRGELIRRICELDEVANPEFLANLSEEELNDYLRYLMTLHDSEVLPGGVRT